MLCLPNNNNDEDNDDDINCCVIVAVLVVRSKVMVSGMYLVLLVCVKLDILSRSWLLVVLLIVVDHIAITTSVGACVSTCTSVMNPAMTTTMAIYANISIASIPYK